MRLSKERREEIKRSLDGGWDVQHTERNDTGYIATCMRSEIAPPLPDELRSIAEGLMLQANLHAVRQFVLEVKSHPTEPL